VVTTVGPRYPPRRRLSVATVPRGHRACPGRRREVAARCWTPPTPATSPAPTTWMSLPSHIPLLGAGAAYGPDGTPPVAAPAVGRRLTGATNCGQLSAADCARPVLAPGGPGVGTPRWECTNCAPSRSSGGSSPPTASTRRNRAPTPSGGLVGLRQGGGTRHRTTRAGTRPRSASSPHSTQTSVSSGTASWGAGGASGPSSRRRKGALRSLTGSGVGCVARGARRAWADIAWWDDHRVELVGSGRLAAGPGWGRRQRHSISDGGGPVPGVTADDGHDRASAQPSPAVSEHGDAT
jgi:hypothetical protein